MEWYLILAIIIAIPIIILPVALIWFMNVSGLYQVIRDARQRQKQKTIALRTAEEFAKR